MNAGVLLFAHNNGLTDYYTGAVWAAKRINHFLNLPVSLVTDSKTVQDKSTEIFDSVFLTDVATNKLQNKLWLNKGRHRAYELSPYDTTLLIDVDYVVCSDKLLTLLDINSDFMCHNKIQYLDSDETFEEISKISFNTEWATVVKFNKTRKVKQIFDTMKLIQDNYDYYGQLHKFQSFTYRNDYSMTMAHRIVNGHYDEPTEFIPWTLLHVGLELTIRPESLGLYDTKFKITNDNKYIKVKDCDIHILKKTDFMYMVENMNA